MERVTIQMRVWPETKEKLEYYKQLNPDIPWDILLKPFLDTFRMPKPQCASTTKPPPKIPITVVYPTEEEE